jgi:hypothetical protein
MKFYKLLCISALPFIFSHCSSSEETTKISSSTHESPAKSVSTSALEIIAPSGWREIEDNSNKLFDIWLVNDLDNSVISFSTINLNGIIQQSTHEEKMELIEKIIIGKKKYSTNVEIIDQDTRFLNDNAKQIRLMLNDNFQNVIIFGDGKNYFESLAYFKENYNPSNQEIDDLVMNQYNIIETCKIK